MTLHRLAAGLLALLLLSCGSNNPVPTPSGDGDESETQGEGEGGDVHGAGATILPALDPGSLAGAVEEPPSHEGPPPNITNLDEAEAAITTGHYPEAEQFFRGALTGASGARARHGLARILLETGRYDDAAREAEQVARDASLRVAAETLRGEALSLRGNLDEAERILGAIAREPNAWRANALLGRLLVRRGRSVEAQPVFMRLIGAYNDRSIGEDDGEGLAYVAMAAWGLGSFQDANDAFRDATRADATRVETQVEWATMFLEKYDAGHAEDSLRVAFRQNPASARAHALMARIRIEQRFDFAAATAYSERALAINPSLIMPHVTLAGMALRDMDFATADGHLSRALAVDANDLEALSMRAAVRFLADDTPGFQAAKREVFSRNRMFSRFYSIVGEYADWEHRYPEIVRMAREAVALNPSDAYAHATLGLNLLRMGDEENGLQALRDAWQRDRFNVHVFNTLELYDEVINREYETFQANPFTFRMHREERPLLEGLIPPTLQGAYADMRRRYRFTPQGPLRIELFSNQQHFAVRTTGLPNLGVQGVCFGKVVTALSPRGGQFNWGQITWHELAHVFHIQLSNNHVPRWFTEGLAEYETIIARPEWRREEDHNLYRAIDTGTLPPLRQMNQAFTHARSAQDMMTAYYASSQIVKYIAEQHGFDDLVTMLREWGAGRRTPEVIQRSLGISIDELDRNFRSHTRQRLSARAGDFGVDFAQFRDVRALSEAAQANPNDADAQAALAAGLMTAGRMEEAQAAAQAAIGRNTNHPLARYLSAMLSTMQGNGAEAEQHLRAILAGGKDGYDIRIMLARAAAARDDQAGMRQELEAATRIDADRSEAWQGLLAVADRESDDALRARALERVAMIDQHDRGAWVAFITLLAEQRKWQELATAAESAQFVAPESTDVHRLLGQARLELNQAEPALRAFDLALATSPESPAPLHLGRARALAAMNRRADARQAADEAVRLDASLAEEARDLR